MVALMRGLDFVCFTKNEYASFSPLFFLFKIYNIIKILNRYKFGRGSCDVRFKDPRISGTHCRIYRKLREATRRIPTPSLWTAARTART